MKDKTNFVAVDMREPHYSTKLWRAYANFIDKNFGEDVFQSICNEVGVPVSHILADGNWVSERFTSRFMEVIKKKTGQPEIAKIVGKSTLSPENINPFEFALMKAMPPMLFFLLFPWEASKVNQYSKFKISKFRPGKIIYNLVTEFSKPAHEDVCLNTIGVLESTIDVFGLNSVSVRHDQCIHRGGLSCTFQVSYSAKKWLVRSFLRSASIAIAAVVAYLLTKHLNTIATSVSWLIPGLFSLIFLLATGLFAVVRKISGIVRFNNIHHQQARSLNKELFESYQKLDRRYHESNMLRGLSEKLVESNDPLIVVRYCADEMVSRFGYKKILVLLLNAEKNLLYGAEVRGFAGQNRKVSSLELKYPAQNSDPLLFANVLDSGTTVFIEEIDSFSRKLTSRNQSLLTEIELQSLVAAPIQSEAEKFGLLVAGSSADEKRLTAEDKHMLEGVARMLSVFFERSKHFQQEQALRNLFQKYVPSLVMTEISAGTESKFETAPRRRCITSMFVDLRGFSTLSERNSPEKIVQLVNRYAEFVGSVVGRYGGIVDNILGDGVVVFFTNDFSNADHARRAINAAKALLNEISVLNEEISQIGFDEVAIGIGVHSGNAVIGAIGSDHKLSFTAIGDTINVAARLQDLGKKYQRSDNDESLKSIALISGDSESMAGKTVYMRDLGLETVRGRIEPIRVFLLSCDSTVEKEAA